MSGDNWELPWLCRPDICIRIVGIAVSRSVVGTAYRGPGRQDRKQLEEEPESKGWSTLIRGEGEGRHGDFLEVEREGVMMGGKEGCVFSMTSCNLCVLM